MIDGAAFEGAVQTVTGFEAELRCIVTVAGARAYPATLRNYDGDRLVDHLLLDGGTLRFLDQGASGIAELLAGQGFHLLKGRKNRQALKK